MKYLLKFSKFFFLFFEKRYKFLHRYLNTVRIQLNLYGMEVQQVTKPQNERNYG
jgi:hypothetical protein